MTLTSVLMCVQASKEIGQPIVHEFTREALVEAGATHTVPPFSVVASNTMDLSVGRCAASDLGFVLPVRVSSCL